MPRFREVEKAAVAALKADGDISAVVSTRVYTLVPQKVLDSGNYSDYLRVEVKMGAPFDTKGTQGHAGTITVDYWTRSRKGDQVQNMLEYVYDLFHKAPLTLAGSLSMTTLFSSDIEQFVEEDGSRHGVNVFDFLIAE